MTLVASTDPSSNTTSVESKSKKIAPPPPQYRIKSYWGIGDEHPSEDGTKKQEHNLSGSCHELVVDFHWQVFRILIDMGGYQWRGWLDRDMTAIAQRVDMILLTHPHMDHIGEYPMAFAQDRDFEGRVYATPWTKKSAEIALTDAAKILARDYEVRRDGYESMLQDIAEALLILKNNQPKNKRVPRKSNGDRVRKTGEEWKNKEDIARAHAILEKYDIEKDATAWEYKKQMKQYDPEKPPYWLDEVMRAIGKIDTHTIEKWWKEVLPGKLAFRFYNSGHIIWSVSILIRITHEKKHKYVLFSGDLGSYKWDIHPTGIAVPPHNYPIDTAMIESTYGNRVREDFEKWLAEFQSQLIADLEKYSQVCITTFAMDRTQNILYRLVKMKRDWLLRGVDIILDSPAGIKHTMNYIQETAKPDATLHMEHAPSIHKSLREDFIARETDLLAEFNQNIDPKNGYYSIAVKWVSSPNPKKKRIILTSSGMADGWMVIWHLEKNISDPMKVFYFPGYLVPWTLGYDLANDSQPGWQKKRVNINWKSYEVRARMKQFNFLSGHGDAEDLVTWLSALNLRRWSNIMVVHGDVNWSSLEFKHRLERNGGFPGINVIVPNIWENNSFAIENPKPKKTTAKKPATKKPSR